jgi:hypothetical protein
MPELSRAQLAVYGAIAVALLLVGARAIRGEGGTDSSFAVGAPSAAASTSGAFTISGQGGDLIVDVTGAVARPDAAVSPTSSPTTRRGSRNCSAISRSRGSSMRGSAVR